MNKGRDINVKDELLGISPLLANMDKENINAPEGYLDNLSEVILDKVRDRDTPIRPLKSKSRRYVWGVAAAVTILIGCFLLYIPSVEESDEVFTYFIENSDFSDIDEMMLYNMTYSMESDDELDYIFNEGVEDIEDELLQELY